jgi:hypothetical protein
MYSRRVGSFRVLLLVALAVACMAAACGGGSGSPSSVRPQLTHREYQAAIDGLETSRVAFETGTLFFRLAAGGISDAECRAGARTFSGNVHRIIDAIAALNPPDDAAALQRRLLAAVGETASRLDALADDVDSGAVTCGEPWNQRAYGLASTTRAQAVIAQYAAAGYRLSLNGR